MRKLIIQAPLLLAAAALMLTAAPTWADDAATVTTAQSPTYGTYLVDAAGMTLYMFMADTQGAGASTCHGGCVYAWPPLLTDAEPTADGQALAGKLGTLTRKNGSTQVTYNGWPLYYFAPDLAAGDTTGQGAQGFGAGWYLLTPQGKVIQHD